ncbi:TetR family transcriptional regulator [Inhella sp.]|uniref:TetR family transcriptional regulator n=1 Tax=Inhella sp. TaxID=1921806 RepID=UPI0035B3AF71
MARKTKQEALETRQKLLDAAELLFHAQGVSHTSLQDIASATGMTRGAVYWHFKNKAELFTALMDRATLPLEAAPPEAPCLQQPGLAALRWGLLHLFHLTAYCPRTRRAFEIALQKMEFSGELEALSQRKAEAHQRWVERHQANLEGAVQAGQLPCTLDTRQAAIGLVALCHGLLHQWLLQPSTFDLPQVGEAATEAYLQGLAHQGASLLPAIPPAERARLLACVQAQAPN